MRVLIAYGSKRGGTAGLAGMIADGLRAPGLEATVQDAAAVRDLDGYDAVVLAGALYANRWHRHARRFARRHREALRARPVWLISSGPLDDSATTGDIPPVRGVRKVMAAIGARGHRTFGGRLEPDARGFPASAMARKRSGDWRDPAAVQGWASAVADQLIGAQAPGPT